MRLKTLASIRFPMTKQISLISETEPPIDGALCETRHRVQIIIQHPTQELFLCIEEKYGITFVGWGIETDELLEQACYREVLEESGFLHPGHFKELELTIHLHRKHHKQEHNLLSISHLVFCQLKDLQQQEAEFVCHWVDKSDIATFLTVKASRLAWEHFINLDI